MLQADDRGIRGNFFKVLVAIVAAMRSLIVLTSVQA
jgi:hypothetical protein